MHQLANPARFMRIAGPLLPWTSLGSILLILLALYFAIFGSPADYQQGETVRIMYVHVPAAWMALFTYTMMAVASGSFLIWKHPLADLMAQAAAPIGAGFTAIALITGALWGQPMWGTWWVWDARLTSVLILFFLYLGYMALVNGFDDPERGSRVGAVLALVGFVNVPIIKFSVDWWNTLHQPASISRLDAPAIDPSMLLPLLLMAAGFKLFLLSVLILKIKTRLIRKRIRSIQMMN
jgi:heme exporter protein C